MLCVPHVEPTSEPIHVQAEIVVDGVPTEVMQSETRVLDKGLPCTAPKTATLNGHAHHTIVRLCTE